MARKVICEVCKNDCTNDYYWIWRPISEFDSREADYCPECLIKFKDHLKQIPKHETKLKSGHNLICDYCGINFEYHSVTYGFIHHINGKNIGYEDHDICKECESYIDGILGYEGILCRLRGLFH